MTTAALAHLGRSRAEMVIVGLEELWGETRAQNIPGTFDGVANWSGRHALTLRRLRDDAALGTQLHALDAARKGTR